MNNTTQPEPESRMTEAQPNLEEMVDIVAKAIGQYPDKNGWYADKRTARQIIITLSDAGYLKGEK